MAKPSRIDLLGLIFLIGFSSLVYEIYSVRILFMFFTKSTQATSLAISSFLAGLAFSSLFFAQIAKKIENNLKIIFWLQFAAAAYGYFVLSNYEMIPELIDKVSAAHLSSNLISILNTAIIWIYLFVPAFFMGGCFPLINGMYVNSLENTSKDTGTVYFWDTMGAILGALLAGFVLIPQLGLNIALMVPVVFNLCCCLLVLQRRKYKFAVLLLVFTLILGEAVRLKHIDFGIDWRTEEEKLASRFGSILFQKESPYGTVTVTNADKPQLYINYREMCTGDINSMSESAIGYVPIRALKPQKLSILNIGLGCGVTAANIASDERVKHLDVVEINPVVVEATHKYLSTVNDNVTENPKLQIHIQEGFHFLRHTKKKYDSIIVDVEEPSIVQSSALYTQDFLGLA